MLLLDDGRLGLIDYGQAKRLGTQQRVVRWVGLGYGVALRGVCGAALYNCALEKASQKKKKKNTFLPPAQNLARLIVALADEKPADVVRRRADRGGGAAACEGLPERQPPLRACGAWDRCEASLSAADFLFAFAFLRLISLCALSLSLSHHFFFPSHRTSP